MRRSSDPPPEARRLTYARAVVRALARARGESGPVPLSPRDWAFLYRWERLGVPLSTIVEALEEGPPSAGGKRRRRRAPLTLAAVAPAVEEAWQVLRSGRTAPASGPEPAPDGNAVAWREAREGLPAGSPLASLLGTLLARLADGADPAELDRRLEAELAEVVDRDLLERVKRETLDALAPFRSRMTDEAFEKTRAIAVRDRLRNALRLPRISRS